MRWHNLLVIGLMLLVVVGIVFGGPTMSQTEKTVEAAPANALTPEELEDLPDAIDTKPAKVEEHLATMETIDEPAAEKYLKGDLPDTFTSNPEKFKTILGKYCAAKADSGLCSKDTFEDIPEDSEIVLNKNGDGFVINGIKVPKLGDATVKAVNDNKYDYKGVKITTKKELTVNHPTLGDIKLEPGKNGETGYLIVSGNLNDYPKATGFVTMMGSVDSKITVNENIYRNKVIDERTTMAFDDDKKLTTFKGKGLQVPGSALGTSDNNEYYVRMKNDAGYSVTYVDGNPVLEPWKDTDPQAIGKLPAKIDGEVYDVSFNGEIKKIEMGGEGIKYLEKLTTGKDTRKAIAKGKTVTEYTTTECNDECTEKLYFGIEPSEEDMKELQSTEGSQHLAVFNGHDDKKGYTSKGVGGNYKISTTGGDVKETIMLKQASMYTDSSDGDVKVGIWDISAIKDNKPVIAVVNQDNKGNDLNLKIGIKDGKIITVYSGKPPTAPSKIITYMKEVDLAKGPDETNVNVIETKDGEFSFHQLIDGEKKNAVEGDDLKEIYTKVNGGGDKQTKESPIDYKTALADANNNENQVKKMIALLEIGQNKGYSNEQRAVAQSALGDLFLSKKKLEAANNAYESAVVLRPPINLDNPNLQDGEYTIKIPQFTEPNGNSISAMFTVQPIVIKDSTGKIVSRVDSVDKTATGFKIKKGKVIWTKQ